MRLLEIRDLSKSFDGLRAVNQVSTDVESGLIKSIIGPNGAGKTTIFNLITGVYPANSGTLRFKGEELLGLKPHVIAGKGICRTFQNVRLFHNMTVWENVMVGCQRNTRMGMWSASLRTLRMRREEAAIKEKARQWLAFVGLEDKADVGAASLPMGQRKLLEMARALASEPEMVLFDEPAAGLNEAEKERLVGMLQKIRDKGITILLVEHDVNLVMRVSQEIVVLNYGEKIAEGTPFDIQNNQAVIAAYLGEGLRI